MSLLSAQVGGFLVLLITSLLMGLLPFRLAACLKRRSTHKDRAALALSCLQCFGSGVLLATVFVHMLPEVREKVQKALGKSDFPLPEVLLCCGLFAVYLLEEVGVLCARRRPPPADYGPLAEPGHDERVLYDARQGSALLGREEDGEEPEYGAVPGARRGERGQPPDLAEPATLGAFRVLIVAAALSVHSVFEGMAIGLENTEASAWLLTAAIATHKSVIAFCLGEQLATSVASTRRALATLALFVLASPLGLLMGALLTAGGGGGHAILAAVLQALAAGTILYVVCFEIIGGERAKPGSGLAKLAAILVGFGFMLLVTCIVQEPEPAPAPVAAAEPTVGG